MPAVTRGNTRCVCKRTFLIWLRISSSRAACCLSLGLAFFSKSRCKARHMSGILGDLAPLTLCACSAVQLCRRPQTTRHMGSPRGGGVREPASQQDCHDHSGRSISRRMAATHQLVDVLLSEFVADIVGHPGKNAASDARGMVTSNGATNLLASSQGAEDGNGECHGSKALVHFTAASHTHFNAHAMQVTVSTVFAHRSPNKYTLLIDKELY